MVIIYLNLGCTAITLLVNQWEVWGIVGKFSPPNKSLSSPVIHPLARLFFITEKLQRHDLFFWWPDKEQNQKTTTFELSGEICGWDFLILSYVFCVPRCAIQTRSLGLHKLLDAYSPSYLHPKTHHTSIICTSQNSSHFYHMHITCTSQNSSHFYHMHITCTCISHGHHMHIPKLITLPSHAHPKTHHMHITCTSQNSSHFYHMHITCTSHHMHITCTSPTYIPCDQIFRPHRFVGN